tara:strand:- start:609 stop:1247 length:639 start_codon:yes stop_codon:yes gene_type:complete
MNQLTFRISGNLLMLDNNQTADPRNKYAKRLAEINKAMKSKTADKEALLEQQSQTLVEAGCYYNEQLGMHLPEKCIRGSVIEGAKLHRLGAAITKYCFFGGPSELKYHGPQTPAGISTDPRFRYDTIIRNKTNGASLPITRTVIPDWSCEFTISIIQNTKLDSDMLIQAVVDAGLYCGIGASRKFSFGRYNVEMKDAKGKWVPVTTQSAAAK